MLNITLMASLLTTSIPSSKIENVEKDSCFWTSENILKTKSITDVQISPDNETILFVVTEPKHIEEKDVFLSQIYKTTITDKSPVQLCPSNVSSLQPRWSPDGKWVAFLSVQNGIKNLNLICQESGEIKLLIKSKSDVQTFSWSPDGTKIAFVMQDDIKNKKAKNLPTSKAYIYKEIQTVNRLWLIDVFSNDLERTPLTSDQFCVRGCGDFGTINAEFDWSIDSKEIIFAYSPTAEFDDFYLDSSLASVNLSSKEIFAYDNLADFEAMPRFSPDGKSIAYMCGNSKEQYTFNRQVAIRPVKENAVTLLSDTFNEGPFISGPNLLGWSKDGKGIYFFEPFRTKNHLVLVPIDGSSPKEIDTQGHYFEEPTLSNDQTRLGCVIQATDTPADVFILNLNQITTTKISDINEHLLSFPKFLTETIAWKSRDGLNIEGLLTYPLNYDENKLYPLLTVVHGGPMAVFDESYLGTYSPYPLASFAEKGFFIFRPNPRGSTGYGKEFRCANYNDFGGKDFNDIMSGIDNLIEKKMIDPEKLGIMGWSYGGYMTSWAITQTNRFKAASIGAALSNLISMSSTTDLHRLLPDYLGLPFENRKLHEERSPLYHLSNVTTPCLIQHGTHDKRVPVSQAFELYHGLNQLGKDVTLVLYPEMGHRFTDPNMQIDVMERNIKFFEEHLNL